MAKNLTEYSTFDANVTVPVGGEERRAASVETAFQQLANRTRYFYNKITALFTTSSAAPEGVVTAVPGEAYYSTYEATYSVKATGTGNTGWLRLQKVSDYVLELCDFRGGSDRTKPLTIKRVATAAGSNYGRIEASSASPVTQTGVYLYAIDDDTHPGECRLNAANTDGRALVLTEDDTRAGGDPALYPAGAIALGTEDHPWPTAYVTSLTVGSGVTIVSGNLTIASGGISLVDGGMSATGTIAAGTLSTTGTVDGYIKPHSINYASLPTASEHTGEVIRCPDGTGGLALLFSNGTAWKNLRQHRPVVMTDADRTNTYLAENFVFVPASVLSADRTITLPTTGVQDGDTYNIVNCDTTYKIVVSGADKAVQFKAYAEPRKAVFIYVGSVWTWVGTYNSLSISP